MTKTTKKIERNMKKAKKRLAEKEMKEKIGLFSKLEDCCLVCEKPFDKQNKEMVQSWCVIGREEQKQIRLYCPTCWNKANDMVKKIQEEINDN